MPCPPSIFLSYARQNDKKVLLQGDKQSYGWVTLFLDRLMQAVEDRVGSRKGELHVEKDTITFQADQPVPAEIEQSIAEATVFLLVASPSYLSSKWCRGEMAQAAALAAKAALAVFVVEYLSLTDTDRARFNPPLGSLPAFPFWKSLSDDPNDIIDQELHPEDDSKEFRYQITKLSKQVAGRLKPLVEAYRDEAAAVAVQGAAAVAGVLTAVVTGNAAAGAAVVQAAVSLPAAPPVPPPVLTAMEEEPPPVVVLASVPPDPVLEERRRGLLEFLESAGLTVLRAESFPAGNADEFLAVMKAALANPRSLFVQLLNGMEGKPVEGKEGMTWVRWQAEAARECGERVLKWAEDSATGAMSEAHRKLLDEKCVWGSSAAVKSELSFPAFRKAVVVAAMNLTLTPPEPEPEQVLVSYVPKDFPAAGPLLDALDERAGLQVKPMVAKNLEEFERELKRSRCVIFVRASAPVEWVRGQLALAAKSAPRGCRLAIFDPPAPGKTRAGDDPVLSAALAAHHAGVLGATAVNGGFRKEVSAFLEPATTDS